MSGKGPAYLLLHQTFSAPCYGTEEPQNESYIPTLRELPGEQVETGKLCGGPCDGEEHGWARRTSILCQAPYWAEKYTTFQVPTFLLVA